MWHTALQTHCFSHMCSRAFGFCEYASRGQKFAIQFWTLEEVWHLPVFFELRVAWLEFGLEWSLSFQICVTSCESCLPLESKVTNAILHTPSASLWSENSNEEMISGIRSVSNNLFYSTSEVKMSILKYAVCFNNTKKKKKLGFISILKISATHISITEITCLVLTDGPWGWMCL